jgi:hypothetical protein
VTGELGFERTEGRKVKVAYQDVNDEVQAWNAQLRQALPADLFHGVLRGYRDAPDKAAFLINGAYKGYRGQEKWSLRSHAIMGRPPGSIFNENGWFVRLPK